MRARDKYKRRPLIYFTVIINMCALIVAKPTTTSSHNEISATQLSNEWQHVNKTCLTTSDDNDDSINIEHLNGLKRHMRLDIDPCDDFYEHACGDWAQDNKYRQTINMMKFGNEQVVQQYVQLFSRAQQHKHKPRSDRSDPVFEKLLHYYTVCQRTEQRQLPYGLRGYAEALHTLGVWNANDSWLDTIARLGRYAYTDHYIKLQILQKNASEHEVLISPHNKYTRVKLDKEIYNIISIYTQHDQASLTQAFNVLESQLEAIVNSSITDCPAAALDDDNECDLLKYYTLNQLQRTAPTINWERFIALQLGHIPKPTAVFGVDAIRTVERIAYYLNNTNAEVRLMYTIVRFFNYLQSHTKLLTAPQADTINNRCVRHMRKTLYLPMLYVYERSYYAQTRAEKDRMINNIFGQLKAQFRRSLERNEMNFSAESLNFLQAKLNSLRLNIGNLPLNVTQQFYIDYINTLNVSGNFYLNHLNALQHYFAHLRQLLWGGRGKHPAWYTFNCHAPSMPDNVDSTAYYYVLSNLIVMPYAYLQIPFFDAHFWPALIYGDLANTLGHEMIHAFDVNFLQYDAGGNIVDDYKQIFNNAEFSRRLAALKPGTEFLTERIADISGSHLAISTFLKDDEFLQNNGKLYFLQFAQFFCGNEDNLSQVAAVDPDHDFNSLRLNYVLSHIPQFAQVYQCEKGSNMNIENRHIMW